MKTIPLASASLLLFLAAAAFGGQGLLYRQPAEDSPSGWERQSLPTGCGHFGANVFGLVGDEGMQITHNAVLKPDPKIASKGVLTDALEIRLKTEHTNGSRGDSPL